MSRIILFSQLYQATNVHSTAQLLVDAAKNEYPVLTTDYDIFIERLEGEIHDALPADKASLAPFLFHLTFGTNAKQVLSEGTFDVIRSLFYIHHTSAIAKALKLTSLEFFYAACGYRHQSLNRYCVEQNLPMSYARIILRNLGHLAHLTGEKGAVLQDFNPAEADDVLMAKHHLSQDAVRAIKTALLHDNLPLKLYESSLRDETAAENEAEPNPPFEPKE